MSEPVRITKTATASDLSESLGWLGEEIQKRAVDQTREEVADALRDTFLDRSRTSVKYSYSPDEAIVSMLREVKGGQFEGLADRFETDGVPNDFRLGLEFAIALTRDTEFEL
ncbi:hypothetical protein [Amycolatopsis sp. lyj-84]|uniref:hypothetical protein n=1 Tax=Amycolatopsis sp. lyj-84 TaxID=2789284 RepID=UPI003978915A